MCDRFVQETANIGLGAKCGAATNTLAYHLFSHCLALPQLTISCKQALQGLANIRPVPYTIKVL
jgi:hypothetical protein